MPAEPTSGPVSVGSPLGPRTAADTDGEVARVLQKLHDGGHNKHIIRILANSATGFRPFVLLTTRLLSSQHYPRLDQEVLILHLAARRATQYEWEEHVPMAIESGVTQDQCDAIERDGGAIDTKLFTPDQLFAVGFADQVIEQRQVDTTTWARAIESWGEEGALDLLMSIGVWGALIPTLIEALGLVHATETAT